MNQLLATAFGGAIGAILRLIDSGSFYPWLGRGFPYGTLAVNIIGSFLIGLLTEVLLLQPASSITMAYRPAVLVGLFGSFTTFSTFSLETIYLIERGYILREIINVVGSVALGLITVWLGLLSGRTFFSIRPGPFAYLAGCFPMALSSSTFSVLF